jgi:transposase
MDVLIKDLDENYEIIDYKTKKDKTIITINSNKSGFICPYCSQSSSKIHSYYFREVQDLPIMNKQSRLIIKSRKIFCLNDACEHKTFSEQHSFVSAHAKKTNRLMEHILLTSAELSSVGSSKLLNKENISAGKSMICELIKKNATDCG